MDSSPPGSSVHGILHARTLEWSGSHSLLQRIFLIQESNLGLPYCRQILYHLSHQGSPFPLKQEEGCTHQERMQNPKRFSPSLPIWASPKEASTPVPSKTGHGRLRGRKPPLDWRLTGYFHLHTLYSNILLPSRSWGSPGTGLFRKTRLAYSEKQRLLEACLPRREMPIGTWPQHSHLDLCLL